MLVVSWSPPTHSGQKRSDRSATQVNARKRQEVDDQDADLDVE